MKVIRPNFEKRGGLIVVVVQDTKRQILMVAYTDEAGYLETLKTGNAVYFSTSRNKRWMKGEESGDVQKVKAILVDCDGDAIIYFVEQQGEGACHTKAMSCFYREVLVGAKIMDAPKAGEKEELPLIEVDVHEDILRGHETYL